MVTHSTRNKRRAPVWKLSSSRANGTPAPIQEFCMQVFTREKGHYFCGHWNGSPLEIGDSTLLRSVPESEARHFHEFFEYYIALEGEAELEVEGDTVLLEPGSVVMVHPRESHRISWVHPVLGARWIVVKQESHADGKHIVSAR